jgi:outer membrane protein assembly factor BamB
MAQEDTNVTDRANSQRTGVFKSKGVSHPEEKRWESDKLFVMQRSVMGVGVAQDYSSGPPPFVTGPQIYTNSLGFYYSTPIVLDGVIYFTLYIGDGYLFAVDGSTGKLKWKTMMKRGQFSYPTVAGDNLYVGAGTFFHAIDLKMQREIWKYETGDTISAQLSPVVVGGVAYFGSSNGNFYALDAITGQVKWIFKTDKRAYWVSPAFSGGKIYGATSQGEIRALNAKTGQEEWKFMSPKGVTSLAVDGETLYFVDYDNYINALGTIDGKPKPDFRRRNKTGTELALYDGKIYFGGRLSGSVYAVDAKTGEGIWKFEMKETCSTPVIAEGMVNFTCMDQKFYAVDAKTGKKSWAITTKQAITSTPTIADGVIYFISDDGRLHAIK